MGCQQFKTAYVKADIAIVIIAPLSIVSEDEWEDSECLYKARQAAIAD